MRNAVAVEVPETRFARVGEDRVAYQVFGEGPPDLIYMAGTGDALDLRWEWPPYALFLRRLASFSRVIMFDQRGQGASDRVVPGVSVWEDWAQDARAVQAEVGCERAALFAGMDATPIALMFAATQPERAHALILFCGTARFATADDYPGLSPDFLRDVLAITAEVWGTEAGASILTPSLADEPGYRRWFAKTQRAAASARDAVAFGAVFGSMDVREVLPSVRAPALVVHRKGSKWVPIEQARYLTDHLPEGRLLLSNGEDPTPWSEPVEETLEAVEAFVTGTSNRPPTADRVLATVLFTDIVDSTQRAAAEGDRHWRTLVESHDTVSRGVIDQHGGRIIRLTGDGVLATFDGPGRAVQCARSLRDALHTLAIDIRAGIHTGEIEVLGDDIAGIAVHVASRVMDHAGPGEIWVSGAVPLLMLGSNVEFEPRGEWTLKGVPGDWQLLTVRTWPNH
jgi:class 3 adenylate cyclase